MATLAAVVQTEQAHRDQLIIDAGQNSIQLCMILEGVVDVLVKSSESALPHIDGQSESSLGRKQMWTKVTGLGAGEYFGETALLDGKPRNATIIAEGGPKDRIRLFQLMKSDFDRLLGPVKAYIEKTSQERKELSKLKKIDNLIKNENILAYQ